MLLYHVLSWCSNLFLIDFYLEIEEVRKVSISGILIDRHRLIASFIGVFPFHMK